MYTVQINIKELAFIEERHDIETIVEKCLIFNSTGHVDGGDGLHTIFIHTHQPARVKRFLKAFLYQFTLTFKVTVE